MEGGTDYALLVDGLAAERDQGITIDVAYRYFETPRRRFILADTPGHEQYTRNMVTGASTSELAVLLVDARKGLLDQTRRHAAIVSLVGIRQVVLAINKMDLVGFDQAVFDTIVAGFQPRCRTGWDRSSVTAIPVCARDGDNVTAASARMPWYTGPTLLAALEAAEPPSPAAALGFRMPVQLVARPDHTFRGYAGTITSGTVRPGDAVVNAVSRTRAQVARIVTMDGDLDMASAGTPVTLVLDREIDVSRGDVIAAAAGARARRADRRLGGLDGRHAVVPRPCLYQLMLGTRSVSAPSPTSSTACDMETLATEPVRELHLNEIGQVALSLSQPVACRDLRDHAANWAASS